MAQTTFRRHDGAPKEKPWRKWLAPSWFPHGALMAHVAQFPVSRPVVRPAAEKKERGTLGLRAGAAKNLATSIANLRVGAAAAVRGARGLPLDHPVHGRGRAKAPSSRRSPCGPQWRRKHPPSHIEITRLSDLLTILPTNVPTTACDPGPSVGPATRVSLARAAALLAAAPRWCTR
jgi:hypothetical protein